ncbi:MAG TPA: toll/interleukin-1 receptor domain-containing protein [Chitinophagaceae bacterium]|nr:toll/interleukin-1 receptor domain-containing protein [Chitinophagaceae bacterium]
MNQVLKKKIFISYRVKDTQAATGRLVDALKQHFDDDQIFLDIDKIEPGLDFTVVISKYLDSSDVMLVIIGPDWMAYNSERNSYRINEQNDWVRLEIATALQRNIRVVPVLLEGASLPDEELLTDDLKPLLRRQSYEISNKRWKYDSEQLIEFLKKILGQTPKPAPRPTAAPAVPKKSKTVYWLIAGIVLLLIILGNLLSNTVEGPAEPVPGNNEPQVQNNSLPSGNTDAPVVENRDAGQAADISGKWFDPNGKGTYVFNQNNGQVNLAVYAITGEQTGEGTGTVTGRAVKIHLNLSANGMLIPSELDVTVSSNNIELNGQIRISDNGSTYSEKIHMERM